MMHGTGVFRSPGCGLIVLGALLGVAAGAFAQETMSSQGGPSMQPPAPIERKEPVEPVEAAAEPSAQGPLSTYDPALFQKTIPVDQLAFLRQFAGMPSNELYRDKQFRALMKSFVPSCTFHYGSDKSLTDALDEVIKGSQEPVQIREGRYLMAWGHMGPYLAGRGMIWIDLQTGIGLGAFYFHPTNGEPTPSVNVFSRQVVKENILELSQLPPAFAEDFYEWAHEARVPPVTTRYFLTGSNKKILLEHDEDYCSPAAGAGFNDCADMNGQAADLDMDAASYLEQTRYATNSTAWMINGADRGVFLQVRANTCGGVLDPLGCRIRVTRERTHVILHAPPPRPHSVGRR